MKSLRPGQTISGLTCEVHISDGQQVDTASAFLIANGVQLSSLTTTVDPGGFLADGTTEIYTITVNSFQIPSGAANDTYYEVWVVPLDFSSDGITSIRLAVGTVHQEVNLNMNQTVSSEGSGMVGSALEAVSTLVSKLAGITFLRDWLRALARKSTPAAQALTEINSIDGTYDPTTDSLEASADESSDNSDLLLEIEELVERIKAKTDLLRVGQAARIRYIPVSSDLELDPGFDYTTETGTQVTVAEQTEGEWNEALLAMTDFRFYARRQNSDDHFEAEATLVPGSLNEFDIDLTRDLFPSRCCRYDWWIYAADVGTGTADVADLENYAVVTGTLTLTRGKV